MDMVRREGKEETLTIQVEQLAFGPKNILVECRNMSVIIAKKAIISHLSCTIEGGQYAHISGPNGCGKSTFLSVLSGFVPPSMGDCHIFMDGRDIDRRAEMMYVSQYPLIFHSMTIFENLALISHRALREIEFGLSELLERGELTESISLVKNFRGRASGLSTGQQRVVLLIAATLSKAQIILLDEPYAGLSDVIAQECRAQARGWASNGKLVVVVEPIQY
jgi:ABC-type multidrug transport system ATPase subunit